VKVFVERESLLGKKEYPHPCLERLKEKFKSKKLTHYRIEFTNQNKFSCDCLLIEKKDFLDLIIEDMEKIETLWGRVEEGIIKKALKILEEEKPLFANLDESEAEKLKNYNLVTLKPIIFLKDKFLWEDIFKAVDYIFFFTANKNEARAYCVKRGAKVIECAAKIHSDLAKGFIRAEIFNCKDLDNFHTLEEAQKKGYLKIVDRDYIVEDGDVINIRFNA